MSAAANLAKLGITLPTPAAPVAAYVPFVVTGNLVFVSGQLPLENGQLKITGHVGDGGLEIETGYEAAKLCAINILAQVNAACGGDLDRVVRCVKVGVFVSSALDFYDHPKVANGASELIEQVFGEAGKHARFALGVAALPRDAAVEVDAVFEIK